MPPDLLSMPNEIIARICEYVAVHDHAKPISNLRLTCKAFYAPATKELAQKFLSEPRVMLTRYSLKTLVKICQHPLFGPHVRGVTFDPRRLNIAFFDQANSILERGSKYGVSNKAMTQARKEMSLYLKCFEQEQRLQQTGEASKLVTKAFTLLRQYGNAVKMTLSRKPIDHDGFDPIGYHKAVKKFPHHDHGGWDYVMEIMKGIPSTFLIMLEAAGTSESDISSLEISAWDFNYCDTYPDISKIHIQFEALTALTDIDLSLGQGALCCGLGKILEATLPFANSLQKVSFTSNEDAEVQPSLEVLESAARVLGSVNSDELTHLELYSVSLRKADLLKVLGQHKKTLKQLILGDTPLVGSWVQLLSWIRDNLSLDKLVINFVSEFDEQEVSQDGYTEPTPWFRGGFDIRGTTAMRPALDKFLAQKRKELAGDEDHGLGEYDLKYGEQPKIVE
ncbi:hypothetical protein D6D23_09312 [Aureobasidium pullulans]|uniref:F-box domain-containing protein n=1 Tax=Aureobasidium pullulans TaxID=5580 RepID=A0A4S8VTE1_AURPU|nr:hypothetical protein D6D23_09312 [Aureobasidium pullulans]THW54367.1 hypothetical protein D6D20_10264 [Aureobasidium pullulans]TIA66162.1 hypothetical protein D6C76_09295 [Aureobasidium pullulans]